MNTLTLSVLLEYLYEKFLVTFILCLIGASAREMMATVRLHKIHIERMMISVVVSSATMCAILDYIELHFSIYVFVCIVIGLWSKSVLNLLMNSKFVLRILSSVTGSMKDPISKAATEIMTEELEKDDTETKDKKKNTSEDENEKDRKDDS